MKRVTTHTIILIVFIYFSASATIINIPYDYSTIQEGIDSSSDGDTVLVQPGTYVENIFFNGHNIFLGSLFLTTGNTSYISSTIIDGNASGCVVAFIDGEDSTALITGFTIKNGYFTRAGGISCWTNSSPIISFNIIRGNTADQYDGNSGGGIGCSDASPIIRNNIISSNIAGGIGQGFGGGISCRRGTPIITNNVISQNITYNGGSGGGIHCALTDAIISNNIISANTARSYGGMGGGISCGGSGATIINNIIVGNSADYRGGGIDCRDTSSITNTIIWGNVAGQGSQIYGSSCAVTYCDIEDTLWPGDGNISADPLFRDLVNGDFHLQDSINCGDPYYSPCIDAGHPDSLDYILDCFHGLGTDRADIGAYGGGGILPSVSIDMLPDNPPVIVPAGGSFTFTGVLQNNTGTQISGDVWIMLELPGGAAYGPIQQFNNITLAPNQGITVPAIQQDVPDFAPLGFYIYLAYCGDYPDNIVDSCFFGFDVTESMEGGADDWDLSGWFKGDENQLRAIPITFALLQNYPNPFNPTTTIKYQLRVNSDVKLVIYNLLGQRVETLLDSRIAAGYHSVQWNASNYSSGIYFYKLTTGDNIFNRRMTLLK